MKDIVKNMWNGIVNEETPEPVIETKEFEVEYTNKEDEEYMKAWTKENDRRHNNEEVESEEEMATEDFESVNEKRAILIEGVVDRIERDDCILFYKSGSVVLWVRATGNFFWGNPLCGGMGEKETVSIQNKHHQKAIRRQDLAVAIAACDNFWAKENGCLAAFRKSGYTGEGVAAYLESRKDHDPMDDDPNRDRNV